jgi:hypothetical protein
MKVQPYLKSVSFMRCNCGAEIQLHEDLSIGDKFICAFCDIKWKKTDEGFVKAPVKCIIIHQKDAEGWQLRQQYFCKTHKIGFEESTKEKPEAPFICPCGVAYVRGYGDCQHDKEFVPDYKDGYCK